MTALANSRERGRRPDDERRRAWPWRALKEVRHAPALWSMAGVIVLFLLAGTVGPLLWKYQATQVDIGSLLLPPSLDHPMGTDGVGRDVFARFLEGSRISILVGMSVVIVGAVVGGLVGAIAGAIGGWLDQVLMRVMDAILAFPALILAMAVTIGLGAGLLTAALGVIIAGIPWYARVVRSEVLRIRNLTFVEAASALGASRSYVLGRHIIPHVLPTLAIQGAAAFGSAILSLAALGFVGLGAQVPTPEWGAMITEGLQLTLTGQWWVTFFPGMGLLVCVTAASIFADHLRDRLDPRLGGDHA